MTHPTIASLTYLGMALTQTLKQMCLQQQHQRLMSCMIKAIDKNLPPISMDSLKNRITLHVEQLQTTQAPQSKDSNRFQYFRGILHNVRYQGEDESNTLFNQQKKFAVIQLVGDNNARPLAQKKQKLMAKSLPKRQKTFTPETGRKSKRIG